MRSPKLALLGAALVAALSLSAIDFSTGSPKQARAEATEAGTTPVATDPDIWSQPLEIRAPLGLFTQEEWAYIIWHAEQERLRVFFEWLHSLDNREYGRFKMNEMWSDSQWPCLEQLWTHESGWNHLQPNRGGSGAYGIPQALPGWKMGPGWQTDRNVQIHWGLGYIAGRYSTPCGAWAHFRARNWY